MDESTLDSTRRSRSTSTSSHTSNTSSDSQSEVGSEIDASTTLPPWIPATIIRRIVSTELKQVGFDSAEQDALEEIEACLFTFFESALILAHELANHAQRTRPNVKDIIETSRRLGVGRELELIDEVRRTMHHDREQWPKVRYSRRSTRPSSSTDPSKTLDSDDEEEEVQDQSGKIDPTNKNNIHTFNSTPAAIASGIVAGPTIATKRTLAALQGLEGVPKLPNKHSFRTTPAYPTPSLSAPFVPPSLTHHSSPQLPSQAALIHLSTLQSRQNDSTQVAASLRNLIRRTSARPIPHSTSTTSTTTTTTNTTAIAGVDFGLGNGEELDVVDYSTEWYSSKTASKPLFSIGVNKLIALNAASNATNTTTTTTTTSGKPVWRLKPGTTEVDQSTLEEVLMASGGMGEGTGASNAGGGVNGGVGGTGSGGVVKRRTWRV